MGSFCLIWNDLIFAPSIGFGYGIELQKKISVYANMDVFIHLTTADFLKEKKKKKKKRIGSPFAFYFNKVLYRFGRWVISTTHKLKITITHLLTKQRIYVVIHRLHIWILDETWSILSNPPSLSKSPDPRYVFGQVQEKIHFKRVPTFLFDFFLCNGTIKNLFFSSLFI